MSKERSGIVVKLKEPADDELRHFRQIIGDAHMGYIRRKINELSINANEKNQIMNNILSKMNLVSVDSVDNPIRR